MIAIIAAVLVLGVGGCTIFENDKTEVPPDPDACDCKDQQLMLNRLRLANAAIQSIDKLINDQTTKDAQEMYSDDAYSVGKKANQAAVYKASEGDEYTGAADTPPVNCKPNVSKGNGNCMKASLQAHENVHQRECLKYDSVFRNYKNQKTMVAFWQEDREGYQKEVEYLDRQIAKVVKKCMQATYIGPETKEDQQQRRAGSQRRVSKYVAGLS